MKKSLIRSPKDWFKREAGVLLNAMDALLSFTTPETSDPRFPISHSGSKIDLTQACLVDRRSRENEHKTRHTASALLAIDFAAKARLPQNCLTERRKTMKRIVITGTALGFMLFLLTLAASPALAFTGGQTIRILSGLPPGGGHDVEGRLIARSIGKYLPGKPRSIIKINMPGAAGLIMTAHFYQKTKPDGLTWAVMGTTQTATQALDEAPPTWNLLKMPVLFTHTGSGAAIVRDFLGVRKPADLLKIDGSKIVVSGRILGEASSMADVLGLELLGVKGYKYVVGYPGSALMARAFFSGEVSYVGGTGLHHALGESGLYHSAIKEGQAYLLWQSGVMTPDGKVVRSPGTDVPTIAEVYQQIHGKSPSGPIWEAYKLTGPITRTLNRYLVLPPGMPQDRVGVLRQAFQKLYSDPEFIKEWERIFGLKLDFIPGDGADKIVKSLLEPSPGWKFIKDEFLPKLKAAQ